MRYLRRLIWFIASRLLVILLVLGLLTVAFYFSMNATNIYIIIKDGMARRAQVIMMDEPSLGLAPLVVKGIFDIIKEINKRGVTVLLIEQNANMALKTADFAYVLETGRITMSGTGAELLTNEEVKKAYLGK